MFVGSLDSGGRFCVDAFSTNLASVAVKAFSRVINLYESILQVLYFKRELQK